jgi:aldehyde:ferredoxin oxidoreductase
MEFGVKGGLLTHEATWKCKELCQRYGMDVGTPIPFAIELFQRGIISEKDTDGLILKWGDEEVYFELLRKIAFREGFGDTLAEGTLRAARKIGRHAEDYMAVIKGMEMLSDRDPRTIGADAFALGWLTCPRGGDNVKTTHDLPEVHHQQFQSNFSMNKEEYTNWFIKRLDMFKEVKERVYGTPPNLDKITLEGNVTLTKWYEELSCIFNSLGFCMFTSYPYAALGPSYYAKLYSTCTGIDKSSLELMTSGERIFNLMRAYIVREGITEKDDDWPIKFFRDPLPEGPFKGAILSKAEFDRALDSYYEMRGWDKTGVPTRERLEELNLQEVALEIWRTSEMSI